MQKTGFYSYKLNNLSAGCKLCVQGRKSVLFITGICSEKCFYCPISEQKYKKDVTYINEWPTDKWENILKEIKLCKSTGVGITGGDPLTRLSRTCSYIKKLKKEFGKKFHIHLYTPLTLVNIISLKKLHSAGLDEIRFHPNLETPDILSWEKINNAKKLNWKVGVEVPLIPKKEKITQQLIDYLIKIKIDFLNLNELEYSDTNASKLKEHNYKTRNRLTYSILGSHEMGIYFLKYIESKTNLNVHYCTAKLKDKVQMRKRILLRASSVKRPFDILSKDGTLIRGAIYLSKLSPSLGYKKKLLSITKKTKEKIIRQLLDLKYALDSEFKSTALFTDKDKLRLLLSKKDAINLSKRISSSKFKIAIVEELPTFDELESEIDFIST